MEFELSEFYDEDELVGLTIVEIMFVFFACLLVFFLVFVFQIFNTGSKEFCGYVFIFFCGFLKTRDKSSVNESILWNSLVRHWYPLKEKKTYNLMDNPVVVLEPDRQCHVVITPPFTVSWLRKLFNNPTWQLSLLISVYFTETDWRYKIVTNWCQYRKRRILR